MPVKIDIIILSNSKTDELKQITLDCIETLRSSEDPEKILFEVIVIESNKEIKPFQYPGTTTFYPDAPFGYNKYLNIGINMTHNDHVCLCNNDLVFHKNWATEILKAFEDHPELSSANPYTENFDYHVKIKNGDNVIRRDQTLEINGVLTGWCIFVKRNIFKKTGPLDERFVFWYADSDYDQTLKKYGLKHALVKSSLVTHLFCQSHDILEDKKDDMTFKQRTVYEKKWHTSIRIQAAKKRLFALFTGRGTGH